MAVSAGGAQEDASPSSTMRLDDAPLNASPNKPSSQTFSVEPEPAADGRQPSQEHCSPSKKVAMPRAKSRTPTSKFSPKPRQKKKLEATRWLLGDKHESQAFRGGEGADFALHKKSKEDGSVA